MPRVGETRTDKKTGEVIVFNGKTWDLFPSAEAALQDAAAKSGGIDAFTAERQRSAVEEPAFKKFQGAIIPTLAGAASLIPGVGPVTGAILSAGGTAINQLVGNEPSDVKQIALSGAISGAAPLLGPATRLVKGAGKAALKGAAEVAGPGALREAGTQAALESLENAPRISLRGLIKGDEPSTATTIARVYATPASKAVYASAANIGAINAVPFVKLTDETLAGLNTLSNPDAQSIKFLNNLQARFRKGVTYDDLLNELQLLKNRADTAASRGNAVTRHNLYKLRAGLLNEADNISPVIREANKLYRREESIQEVANALRASNSGVAVRRLLENNELVSGAFKQDEAAELLRITDQISDVASAQPAGIGRQLLSAVAEPISKALNTDRGRQLLSMLFKRATGPNKRDIAILAAAGQFARAWVAQEASAAAAEQGPVSASTGAGGPIPMLKRVK